MNIEKVLYSSNTSILTRMNKEIMSYEEVLFKRITKELVDIIADLGSQKGRSKIECIISAFFYLHDELTQYDLIELTKMYDLRDVPLEEKKGFSMGTISSVVNKFVEQGYAKRDYRKDSSSNSKIPIFKYYYSANGTFIDNIRKATDRVQVFLTEIDQKLQNLDQKLQDTELQRKKGYEILNRFHKNMKSYINTYKRIM